MQTRIRATVAILIYSTLFFACQKEFTNQDLSTGPQVVVDDNVKVTALVNGVVVNESNQPVSGATVTCGGATTTTNSFGIFYFKNVQVSKANGSVRVVKSGFFTSTRSFMTVTNKSHFVKIQMLTKSVSGLVDAVLGGTINLQGGASIKFPANAFVKTDGTPASGSIAVSTRWIDPTSPDMPLAIPGDLRGIKTNGVETMLSTYGMIGAELVDASGNMVKIAPGKLADVDFPIPSTLQSSAPNKIALWHFDEVKARWLEEGSADKVGNMYKAKVSKFSFWNVDDTLSYVRLECTFVDSTTNAPLANQMVILRQTGTNNVAYGFTNCFGYVSGPVPSNVPLTMEVRTGYPCRTVLYSRNIAPLNQNTNLDTIRITSIATNSIRFSGQITNCVGTGPSSNSYLSFYAANSGGNVILVDSNGRFSFIVYNCGGSNLSYTYQATNITTQEQTAVFSGTTTASQVSLGTIALCAAPITVDVYVGGYEANTAGFNVLKVWKNGVATDYTDGTSNCNGGSIFVTDNRDVYLVGHKNLPNGFNASFWKNGIETSLNAGSSSYGREIYVNNSDVYVLFSTFRGGQSVVKIWRNGSVSYASNDSLEATAGYAMFINGNDIYVGGNDIGGKAGIWKNGARMNLTTSSQRSSSIFSVFVNGNDVYAAGTMDTTNGNSMAVYWKNGVPIYLTDGNGNSASATGIFVEGTDVYVSGRKSIGGNSSYKAQVWKNGIATVLSVNNDIGSGNSVFVKNGDVYIADSYTFSGYSGKVWKNNLATVLTGTGLNNLVKVVVK